MSSTVLLAATITIWPCHAAVAAPRLRVSENRRFLVYADGKPLFWLGDTAWELFHRLNREEADRYLENRARKDFMVSRARRNPPGTLRLHEVPHLDVPGHAADDGKATEVGHVTSLAS